MQEGSHLGLGLLHELSKLGITHIMRGELQPASKLDKQVSV